MKIVKLSSWVVMAFMMSNFFLYPANVALAKPASTTDSAAAIAPVSINKADVEGLQMVRGIGPALAERIIDYREANGNFKSLDQLKAVRGIGDAKFEKIKSQMTV